MIIIGGENLIDMVQFGEDGALPTYKAIPGGSPYNCCIAAARQGQATAYLTPISTDRLGDLLAKRLEKDQVKLLAPRHKAPSSLAVVSVVNGIPSYGFYREGTAERQIRLDDLINNTPAEAQLFHIGSLGITDGKDAAIWQSYFKYCHDKGLLTSLDPNIRSAFIQDRDSYLERLRDMLAHTDILKFSDEDISWIYPDLSHDDAISRIRSETSAQLVIMTRGADGAIGYLGDHSLEVKPYQANPLEDTVGAGDTFMGSLLAWLLENNVTSSDQIASLSKESLGSMMDRASLAACLNCQAQGCNPPYKNELSL